MERALGIELLRGALAGRSEIPTAEELQRLLGDVEVQLFLQEEDLPNELLEAAWYLHAVASVDRARERYTLHRQTQAFLVSAHIFDLALNRSDWTKEQRLSIGFASSIGYRRADREPNATAIMNRLRDDISIESPVDDHLETLALEVGVAFLGYETRTLLSWLTTWRRQLDAIARAMRRDDLTTTAYGTTHMVVLGADDLLAFLTRGERYRLQRARTRLRSAAVGEAGPGELNARWVAAHLLALSGEAEAGSVWNMDLVPPGIPDLARQAFTLGNPPVLTLWSPQRELLAVEPSPFDRATRRMVLAVPTSGGKTLMAQLLTVAHLASGNTSVCYVAPTRSLGREVRRSMASRVRLLQKETGYDQPDYPTLDDFIFGSLDAPPADVEVMTPERLLHMMRHDMGSVLETFGMFIFDEAQLIKESGRGFALEQVISALHYATRDSNHRIVLISAAMGNAGGIAEWISPHTPPVVFKSEWRGPRRLYAAFSTEADWESTRAESIRGRAWPYRLVTSLTGLIRLRLSDRRTARLEVTDTDWVMVRKARTPALKQSGLEKDQGRSTPLYRIASEMITDLGHAGPVLVVTTTRDDAQRLARGLADQFEEDPAFAPLADFVRVQLGDEHPLVDVLRRGVGYHHAGLPSEVLEALEDAVRDNGLPYLACTSTLTDGVNLPVRTVVIYDANSAWQDEEAQLRGARLVNAMGRAGRAGKETEGWIVVVRPQPASSNDFRLLDPTDDDLAVNSSLVTESALEEFAQLEQQLRQGQDAIFDAGSGAATDFVAFVWFMLTAEEDSGADPEEIDTDEIADATLASHQSANAGRRCRRIAAAVQEAYIATDSDARRRWARTGTSVGSAKTIDSLARRIVRAILDADWEGTLGPIDDPAYAIRFLRNIIDRLLALPENRKPWRLGAGRQGTDEQTVKPADLLVEWIEGVPLTQLASNHLGHMENGADRIELLVNTVTEYFEHYLAWTVGALIEIVNRRLDELESELRLCPELGGYIRYGVSDPGALMLMTSGIRSRRLAHAVVRDTPADLEASHEHLRNWLAGMGIAAWRDRYQASASEVLDLLEYTRLRSRSLVRSLLEAGSVEVDIPDLLESEWSGTLSLEPLHGEQHPAPLMVYSGRTAVATTSLHDHTDLMSVLETGLAIDVEIDDTEIPARLTISLAIR
ncbi:DEAD/DEAH box helicase [Allorhizocola rhizosphaerae]|uniref:DEAD/DEAH box helicase n=1 Tax=Allorhizocola rhizosphaerae TaxID=1872709 RepID=UPI000E3D0C5C|nr:DEAD/DEAH box helicase [Allorhizocola rhizosphaerae]